MFLLLSSCLKFEVRGLKIEFVRLGVNLPGTGPASVRSCCRISSMISYHFDQTYFYEYCKTAKLSENTFLTLKLYLDLYNDVSQIRKKFQSRTSRLEINYFSLLFVMIISKQKINFITKSNAQNITSEILFFPKTRNKSKNPFSILSD